MLGDSPTRNPRVRKSAQTKTTFESVFYALRGRLSNHGKLIKRRGPRILEIFQGWNRRRTRFSSRCHETSSSRYSHHDALNFSVVQRSRCHFYSCNQAILLLLRVYDFRRLLLDCVASQFFPTRNRVITPPPCSFRSF